MGLILITAIVIGVVMVAMSVGVLFSNRCLRGSCGGPDVIGPDLNGRRVGTVTA